jgi:hypothetical protein
MIYLIGLIYIIYKFYKFTKLLNDDSYYNKMSKEVKQAYYKTYNIEPTSSEVNVAYRIEMFTIGLFWIVAFCIDSIFLIKAIKGM